MYGNGVAGREFSYSYGTPSRRQGYPNYNIVKHNKRKIMLRNASGACYRSAINVMNIMHVQFYHNETQYISSHKFMK